MSTDAEIEIYSGMDRDVLLRLLLRIVLLLSFASCTLPARLQWKSPPSPSPYDYIPIRQPSHSSDVTPSLYDIIPFGESPSSQTANGTLETADYDLSHSGSCNCSVSGSGLGSVSGSGSTSISTLIFPSGSGLGSGSGSATLIFPSCNVSCSSWLIPSNPGTIIPVEQLGFPTAPATVTAPAPSMITHSDNPPSSPSRPPASLSDSTSPNDYTPFAQPSHSLPPTTAGTTPSTGASRGGLNLLQKMGTAIAVIVVVLVTTIAVIKASKKKKGAGTDTCANPSVNSLEAAIIDIRTHTGEDVKCLKEGIDICTYTREELAKATNNFTTKVGQGVSGFVYRATLSDDRMGAVKRATDLDPTLFKQELSVLLRLPRHPHLVDLIGLCLQADERILVFDFISNGNLYDRLHKNKGLTSPLSWAARMNIAFQVAVALQYLHEEAKPPILHRDIKSANVLLEDDNCAKLADFGLSKLGPKDNQFTITAVRGSYGYMDPQYVKTRRYSAKSDVYSFGVLLLELITGLKSLHEDTPLAEWTQTYRLSEDIDMFMTIVDRNMMGHINTMELQNMIKVANLCLRDLSEERSSMREIVNMMQETRNLKANGNLSDGGEAPLLGNGKLCDGGAPSL